MEGEHMFFVSKGSNVFLCARRPQRVPASSRHILQVRDGERKRNNAVRRLLFVCSGTVSMICVNPLYCSLCS